MSLNACNPELKPHELGFAPLDSSQYFFLYANRFGVRRSVRVDNKCLCGYDRI